MMNGIKILNSGDDKKILHVPVEKALRGLVCVEFDKRWFDTSKATEALVARYPSQNLCAKYQDVKAATLSDVIGGRASDTMKQKFRHALGLVRVQEAEEVGILAWQIKNRVEVT
jgi:hypothetical protein